MKSRDILNMLEKEIDTKMPNDSMLENITATPIKVTSEGSGGATAVMERPSIWKNKAFVAIMVIVACIAVLTCVLVPVFMNGGAGVSPIGGIYADSTFLTMDINPSIDFVVTKDGKVKNVVSRNNDGDVLLSNGFRESIVGKDVETAVSMTLNQAQRLGYIDATRVDTTGKVNAVRFTAASDNDKKATNILSSVKGAAVSHLKSNGIFMVVVDKKVTRDDILSGTNIGSIAQLGESIETKDAFHYIDSVVGKSEEEILKAFKEDFMANYISDELDDVLDDIDENLEYISDIVDLCNRIFDIEESSEGLFKHPGNNTVDRLNGYWYYLGQETIENSAIKEIVDDITAIIDEYNEEIMDVDDDDLVDASGLFEYIDIADTIKGKFALHKMKTITDVYEKAEIKERLENLVDDIEKNIEKVDALLEAVNDIFGKVIDNVREITAGIKAKIEAKIEAVATEAEEYYNVCKASIDKMYRDLIARNENNVGTITPEQYDAMMEELMEGYDDLDDFWESTHAA